MSLKLLLHKQEDISSFQSVSQCGLGVGLLRLSYLAYCAAESDAYDENRIAMVVNREVVSDSSPEAYC